MNTHTPMPVNEMERIIELSEFDLDYSGWQDSFKDLTKLAAKVAGTEISMVNLIDSFTQWTISNYGLPVEQMTREESICQYTIVARESFEVKDLTADNRFKDKAYVASQPKLRYYFGIPLQTDNGFSLGALCVLDTMGKEITPEKVELLKIIADEIVNRLTALKVIQTLRAKVKEANETQKKVAHDIRGPLGGIIGLAQIISEQGDSNKMDEVLEFIKLIQKSGDSLLELADEILSMEKKPANRAEEIQSHQFTLAIFKNKLEKLYAPQALHKKIMFSVDMVAGTEKIPFLKNKLLQITGNLISNAIKFTPQNGKVTVTLELVAGKIQHVLKISVKDSGRGLDENAIQHILNGDSVSTDGTFGEHGYGFGLALVKHLVDGMKGSLQIHSKPGEGASFEVSLPQKRV